MSKPAELTQLEIESGLEFVAIPAGCYRLGDPPTNDKCMVYEKSNETAFYDSLKEISLDLPLFYITTQPLRLSHWQKLLTGPYAAPFEAALSQTAIERCHYNEVKKPYALRESASDKTRLVRKDLEEPDPALTLTFAQARQAAEILGLTLPAWDQWEAATRGPEGYLYPWGNKFDGRRVKITDYSYTDSWDDDESVMGHYGSYRRTTHRYRIDSFGRYADMASPFGLLGLARWGREWSRPTEFLVDYYLNLVEAASGRYDERYYLRKWEAAAAEGTGLLRSICHLGWSDTYADYASRRDILEASAHRSFSGPNLARMRFSEATDKHVASFRLVYVP